MASMKVNRNKAGEVISYRFLCCIGRDERGKQIWRTCTIPRPEGLTPKAEEKEVTRLMLEWEKEQKDKAKEGVPADADKITLAEFIGEWKSDHVNNGNHSPNGRRFFDYTSKIILDYYGNKTKLADIDAKSVIKFLNTLGKDGKGLSEATRQHCLGTLNNILNFAVRTDYIKKNPCDKLKDTDKPILPKKKVDHLEADEARQFLAALADEPLFWKAFFTLLIYTGLRRGEAMALRWGDYDTRGRELHIDRSVSIADAGATVKVVVKTTKSGYDRYVPVTAALAEVLEQWRSEAQRIGIYADGGYIFPSLKNPKEPMYPTTPSCWLSRFEKRHGLRSVSPHDLRHTAASLSIEGGADLKQIQELLGHHNIAITVKHYIGLSEKRSRRAAEGIADILKPTTASES